MSYVYCAGCNVNYVTGCGEEAYHLGCPYRCSLCGRPMRAGGDAEYGWCPGHSVEEAREAGRGRRERRA